MEPRNLSECQDVLDFDLAGDDAHSISDRQLEQLRRAWWVGVGGVLTYSGGRM